MRLDFKVMIYGARCWNFDCPAILSSYPCHHMQAIRKLILLLYFLTLHPLAIFYPSFIYPLSDIAIVYFYLSIFISISLCISMSMCSSAIKIITIPAKSFLTQDHTRTRSSFTMLWTEEWATLSPMTLLPTCPTTQVYTLSPSLLPYLQPASCSFFFLLLHFLLPLLPPFTYSF